MRLDSGWKLLLAAVLAAGLVSCKTVRTTQGGAVGVDRQQTMSALVSVRELEQGANQAYRQALSAAGKKGVLNTDAAQAARVRAIAQRLIPATAVFRSDAPGWQWEINVINGPEVNAWCMPGGKIAVYSGLIQKLNATDDELAAVMGHEIAHALREHARERASQQINAGIVATGVGVALGGSQGTMDMASLVANLTYNLPNSRLHETEADRIGVELAARAGYDPRAAISLWEKMRRVAGGGPPQWLSTHPSSESRIRDLQDYAARVMPLYERARRR
ncbi:MAG: M48 family metallopeptidase [Burkholderiales bacterium]|nr:M48 family metallopeptidase [Burkholderiales bacterium]